MKKRNTSWFYAGCLLGLITLPVSAAQLSLNWTEPDTYKYIRPTSGE